MTYIFKGQTRYIVAIGKMDENLVFSKEDLELLVNRAIDLFRGNSEEEGFSFEE